MSAAVSGPGAARKLLKGSSAGRSEPAHSGGSGTAGVPSPAVPAPALVFRKRGEAYTAEDMADDAVAVMAALGWESAHLLGVSLGGAVAQRVALRHPRRVRTLTTMAAVPGDVHGLRTLCYIRTSTLARFARLRFPDTPEGAVEAGVAVSRLLASPRRPFDEAAAREAAGRNPDRGMHDQQAQSRQIGAQWHGPPIEALSRPALVLHGEDDPLIKPVAGRVIARRVPGARLVLLPRVGHEIPEPAWDRIAAEVRALADTSAPGPAAARRD
ncbi:alpha/beta fold hydrolase [Streptomyces albus]|uniref:alpha/beta fold hydrolase n=1 Tax=Streptomyces albus TaxID=1888 RepID=UPI001FD88A75|nr:alpha/beta fold hydrolase [Streptomyces albus]UVN59321.1 alpha/beta hydrolase [Streptomyces albus]